MLQIGFIDCSAALGDPDLHTCSAVLSQSSVLTLILAQASVRMPILIPVRSA